jgi:hypothetical protein
MKSKNVAVCLAVIHNNYAPRNRYLFPNLTTLKVYLDKKFRVEEVAISEQPKIVPHNTAFAFFRRLMLEKLHRDWSRYRKIAPPNLLIYIYSFIRCYAKQYFCNSAPVLIWNRKSFIETILTDKHIRAWNAFIETGCDYLVSFEDDAIFKKKSKEKLAALIDTLVEKNRNQYVYIDLAAGLDLDPFSVAKLRLFEKDGFVYYSKPITNTSCVFLMSRSLVLKMLNEIVRRPDLRLINTDWMINKLFMRLSSGNFKCTCMHANPPIFEHGSLTGVYETLIS